MASHIQKCRIILARPTAVLASNFIFVLPSIFEWLLFSIDTEPAKIAVISYSCLN
jgi:hypothetical protein